MMLYEYRADLPARDLAEAAPAVTLASGVSRDLPTVPYLRERVKLTVRALFHGSHTRPWLSLLNSHPAFAEFAAGSPRLLQKIYRPYLTARLDMGERLAVLGAHYAMVFRHGLTQLVAQACRGGVPLASVEGKSGCRYQILLRAIEPMEREGELVLQLVEGEVLVYSVAFTFSDLHGQSVVSIGCIQGPKHDAGLEAIRKATRELHGLRPKQMMVKLVSQLGHALGCTQLRLVGNANRVVGGAMRQGRVLADYDQLWLEMGAQHRSDGDFQLACSAVPELDLERICSKKRSEARKRHAVTVELADALTRNFLPRPPALVPRPAPVARLAAPARVAA